jgi:membrane-associated protease RseP (regulator of RpoE activity)
MGNSTPQNFEPDFDISAEDRISQLISAMPRVEAPGDFGFRVKARIAEARPVNNRPVWLPTALKAAAPLGLALAVGGYFAVTSLYVTENPATQAAVETVRPGLVQAVPAAPAQEPISPPVIASAPDETKIVPVAHNREVAVTAHAKRPLTRKRTTDNNDSGSYVEAATGAQKPSPVVEDPAVKPENIKGTPAGEVLTKIGVNALFGEGGWKADSISPNTAAAKAGVKAGDIIESVDDQDLTDLGSVAKPAKGKKLKVKRDGKTIEIVID